MEQGFSRNELNIAATEEYSAGTVIFTEGSSGDWIYLIKSGQVEIYKALRGKKVVVDMLGPGDIFGEVSFIDKEARSASARAVTDTVLGVYDREFLTEQLNRLPSDLRLVFDYLARRLRKMTNVAVNLAGRKSGPEQKSLEIVFETPLKLRERYLKDLAGGGIRVATPTPLPLGAAVSLKLILGPEKTMLNPAARVARSEKGVMDLEFTSLGPEGQARLNAFLRRA